MVNRTEKQVVSEIMVIIWSGCVWNITEEEQQDYLNQGHRLEQELVDAFGWAPEKVVERIVEMCEQLSNEVYASFYK